MRASAHLQIKVSARGQRRYFALWRDAEGRHQKLLGPAHVKDSGRRTARGARIWRAGDGPKPHPSFLTPMEASDRLVDLLAAALCEVAGPFATFGDACMHIAWMHWPGVSELNAARFGREAARAECCGAVRRLQSVTPPCPRQALLRYRSATKPRQIRLQAAFRPMLQLGSRTMTYRLIDLFAGCGGMTRGFVDTGMFEPVFAVEMDRDAAATYAANFGEDHVVAGRIERVGRFPGADVVIGGPPCQGFSPLNRDRVGPERRALWREYLRALEESGAVAFVMENVPELLTAPEFVEFRDAAEKIGYRVSGAILNAADFGVPQRRRRAIVVGSRLGQPPRAAQTHSSPDALALGTQPWRTFREAVAGLPLTPDGCNWHNARNPRPESVRRYKAVPRDGGNRFQMQDNLDKANLGHLVPACWRNKPTGTTDVFGRLWWDRPALTIRTEFFKPEKGRYLHPSAHRPITIREAARCMTFPDDFVLPTEQSMTSVARQVGNAVPCLLAQKIAEALAEHLGERRSHRFTRTQALPVAA